jgi:hypothetical protein
VFCQVLGAEERLECIKNVERKIICTNIRGWRMENFIKYENRPNIDDLSRLVKSMRLRWLNHVERMQEGGMLKQLLHGRIIAVRMK